jgi:hypothetical protein
MDLRLDLENFDCMDRRCSSTEEDASSAFLADALAATMSAELHCQGSRAAASLLDLDPLLPWALDEVTHAIAACWLW